MNQIVFDECNTTSFICLLSVKIKIVAESFIIHYLSATKCALHTRISKKSAEIKTKKERISPP